MGKISVRWVLLVFVSLLALAPVAQAAAVLPGFNSDTLAANDDGSTGLVPIGFSVNFYGVNRSQLFVNNNGNVTFDAALSTFTPFPLLTTNRQIIAPFFGDVDTRGGVSNPVTYGAGLVDGRAAFGVNWVDVDYFNATRAQPHDNLNSFQLIMIDRSDVAPGDFDFWFNYDRIQWEAGTASSSNSQGCGGFTARVGFSNGTSTAFELPGSDVDGAFLDSGTCVSAPGPNALILGSRNSDMLGRYIFTVRNGQVDVVPEPITLALLGAGLLGLAVRRRS